MRKLLLLKAKLISLTLLKRHGLFIAMVLLLVTAWSVRLANVHYNGYDLIYATHTYYHSDDVAQANILWNWQHGYRGDASVGDDNWVIKYPLYIATNNLSISPLKKLFINSWVVLAVTALLILYAQYRFVRMVIKDERRRAWALIIATLVLVAIPPDAFGILKMPNSRNIEIGIFMLLISYLYSFVPRNGNLSNRTKIQFGALLGLAGLLFMDDPLFIYMALPPLIFVLAWKLLNKSINRTTTILMLLIVAVPLLVSEVLKKLFVLLLPVSFVPHTSSFATIDQLLSTLRYLGGRGSAMLGVDVLGRNPFALHTVVALITLLILIVAVVGVAREQKLSHKRIFTSYHALLWAWVPLLLVISSLGVQPGSSRYIALLVFMVPLALVFVVNRLAYLRQVYFIAGMAFCLFSAAMYSSTIALAGTASRPNTDNYATIKILNDMQLTKGYTRFWDAGIDTYLSGHKITFTPADCNKELKTLSVGHVLFDRAEVQKPATKSFYLYVPDDDMRLCSPEALVASLGKPKRVIDAPVVGQKIVIYDYDITTVLMRN